MFWRNTLIALIAVVAVCGLGTRTGAEPRPDAMHGAMYPFGGLIRKSDLQIAVRQYPRRYWKATEKA